MLAGMPTRNDAASDSDQRPTPSGAPDPLATTPTEIKQASDRQLSISWADGGQSLFDVRELRLACGCASCVDEWTGEERIDPQSVPDDVHPTRIEPVGRYAIQIYWSDGHETGIYPFERLRSLAAGTHQSGEPR
jgi:ATP-binding protein involved in chromosome partitioning